MTQEQRIQQYLHQHQDDPEFDRNTAEAMVAQEDAELSLQRIDRLIHGHKQAEDGATLRRVADQLEAIEAIFEGPREEPPANYAGYAN